MNTQLEIDGLMTVDGFRKHTDTLFKRSYQKDYNLNHAQMGINGELGELVGLFLQTESTMIPDELQRCLIEEFGDLLFYLDALAQDVDVEPVALDARYLAPLGTTDVVYLLLKLVTVTGCMTDHIKKHLIYNSRLDPYYVGNQIVLAVSCMDSLINLIGSNWDEIRTVNYNKLKVRYPSGYSDKAAQERVDKQ